MRKNSKHTAVITTTTPATLAPAPTMPGSDLTMAEIAAAQVKIEETQARMREMQAMLAENAREAELIAERLHLRVKGTRENVAAQAAAAARAQGTQELMPVLALGERVDGVLRDGPAPTDLIARRLGVSEEEVAATVAMMMQAGTVTNIGSPTSPRLCRVPGDNASAQELLDAARKLVSYQPMTWQEVTEALKARPTRISGVIARLQEDPEIKMFDVAKPGEKARWMIVPKTVNVSRIKKITRGMRVSRKTK